MNIVKLQNDLKDLSDQQLMGSMQSGSAPQYLVLAEMQRRKKLRDEASTPNEPQAQGTVADEIMGGIAAIPMGSMDMASGGLVSFAEGGRGKDKDKEEDRDWRYYKPNAGLFGKTDTPLMVLNPQYWSNMLQDMQGVPREEWRGQGAPGVLEYAKGGYLQGEADACWKNPETGEQMCPPSKPNVEYPETGQRKDMASGGIVALQAGGTPSEARALLAAQGVDTTGMSDEEVMVRAATYAGVMAPNVDVAEPTPDTGFSPVPVTEAPLPPAPMTPPEPAPKAESGFMDKLTGGITNLLGIGEAKAEGAVPAPVAEEPPQPRVEYPVPTTAQLEDPIQARQWLGENAPAWYDPKGRSDAQVVEDIKAYAPGGYREGQKQRDAASEAEREARVNPPAQAPAPQSNLPRVSPEGVGVYAQSAARAEDPAEKARLMGIDEAYQRAVPVPGHEGWRYDGKTGQYFNPEGRLESGPVKGFKGTTRGRFETREGAKGAADTGTTPVDKLLPDQPEGLAALISDPTMERYYELLRQEKGVKDKSNVNRYLMEMGLRMAAGKSPDFLTNLAEAGVGTLESAGKLSEEERKREEAISEEISKLLAAREVSLAKAETAQLTQLARANTRLKDIATELEDLTTTPEKRKALEEERDMLIEYTKGLYPGGGSKYSEAGKAAAAAASFNR